MKKKNKKNKILFTIPCPKKQGIFFYKNFLRNLPKGIVFEKNIGEGNVVYIQFDHSGRQTIQGKTLYVKKIKDTPSGRSSRINPAESLTSKTTEPASFIIDRIPQNGDTVNGSIRTNAEFMHSARRLENDPVARAYLTAVIRDGTMKAGARGAVSADAPLTREDVASAYLQAVIEQESARRANADGWSLENIQLDQGGSVAQDGLPNDADGGMISSNHQTGELAIPYQEDNIPTKIKEYIKQMPQYGSAIEVETVIPFEDISLLARQTGTEFASITIDNKNYIIRGETKETPLPDEIISRKGVLNCHSHPYIGDVRPSPEDMKAASKMPWQKEFYIVSPDGKCGIYNSMGIIETKDISRNMTSKEGVELYKKLFGED